MTTLVSFMALRPMPTTSTTLAPTPAKSSFVQDQSGESTVIFYREITQDSALELTTTLEQWSATNPQKPLRLLLNSPGGSVQAAFSLIDELRHLRSNGHKVTISVYGMAASAAGFLLQAADHRVIGANSMILIHEVSSATDGKLSSMKKSIAFDEKLEERCLQLLANPHLSLEEIHKHIDGGEDWWLSAQEAKTLGLVDELEGASLQ